MTDQQINIRRHISIACYLLVGCYLLVALYLVSGFTKPGWFYRSGVPAGADFLQVWSASSLASQGSPAAVYDVAALKKVETAVVGDFSDILPWHYPPTFLLMMLPVSALNYFAAFALWSFIPLGLLLILLSRICPDRLTVWLALAFMGTAQNLFYGQGAALVGCFMAGGLLLLDSRPILGGMLLSLIINYKPHLGLVILVALLAGRHWRALGALAVAGAALVLLSAWVFGLETWLAFGKNLQVVRAQLADADLWDRMPTIFGTVRLLGGGAGPALALQMLTALLAAAGVFWVWRRRASLPIRASVLVLGTLLVTPHAINYDLALLLLPIAWLAGAGLHNHWRPGDQLILLLAWLSPFINMISVAIARIHLAPLIIAVFLLFLLKRAVSGIPEENPIPSG